MFQIEYAAKFLDKNCSIFVIYNLEFCRIYETELYIHVLSNIIY